jgi:outer membrane protein TolC
MGYNDLDNALFERTFKYSFAPTVELRQPLLKNLGSKEEKATIKIANHQTKISEEEFRQTVIEIATQVSTAYWQLFLFKELVKINQQNFEMAEEVYRRETVRLAENISKPLDVERARSNAEARRSTLLRSKERLQVVMDRLKLLLNWSNLTIDSEVEIIPIEAPETVPISVDEKEAIEKAISRRPEIESARQALEIRRVEEDLSAHKRLPKLDVFARYSVSGYGTDFSGSVDDTGINDDDSWAVGLNFEWPIGNRSANARYRKKKLERKQATAEVDRVRDRIQLEVKEALLAIDLAKGEIRSTRLAKEASEQVVEGEFARFDLGEMSNEELLRAQDLLAVTSRNYVRAIIDYNIALAELSRAQGVLIPGVSIEK